MKDLKAYLVDYNTLRRSQPATPPLIAKVLIVSSALQVLSFLCLTPTGHEDLIAKTMKSIISLFNLPYFCKELGITLFLPLAVLLLLHIGYILKTSLCFLLSPKYKKIQDFILISLCRIEHYVLKREVVFLCSLATGMEAIFRPQTFIADAQLPSSLARKVLMGFGIVLVTLSVMLFFWQIYIHISVSFKTETVRTEHRSGISKKLMGALLPIISALAYLDSPTGVFVCVGIYLLIEVILAIVLGNHATISINNFTLWTIILQFSIYVILLLSNWSISEVLEGGMSSQRSIGILLIAPLFGRIILNLERRRMRYLSQRIVACLSNDSQGLTWLEVPQFDLFLRQMNSKFKNIETRGPEIQEIIETIIRYKQLAEKSFLQRMEENLMERSKDQDWSDYPMKEALQPSLYEFINSVYSSILGQGAINGTNIDCYFSYIAFHKDITGNHGKAFIILARLQRVVGASASSRVMATMQLAEQDIQRQIAGSGTQKTISAEILFSFLDRSEKIQSSIEDYISKAFGFYERLQNPIININDIKSNGKKLLDERSTIIKELDGLIKINEYHQQTLLLYEFFLSEIVEEKAEGRFFQIKNRIDIFNVAEYYYLYRQQKQTGAATYLEALGWDMNVEFFANQLDEASDYSVVVFSLNPENTGKIMRCSANLYQFLGIESQSIDQMNISNLEVTLFNPQNLKTLQEKILKGETSLKDLPETDHTLYMKHSNGSLIAYSFVADVEIYGRDPCIACYLRKKKIHEQEFILFTLDNQTELIGMSDALITDVIRCGTGFNEIASYLNIIDMIPSLKSILFKSQGKSTWTESEALLIVPHISQRAVSQVFFMINYSGKIQTIPLVDEKIGVIEITYSEQINIQILESKNATLTTLPKLVTRHKLDGITRISSRNRKNQMDWDSLESKAEHAEEDINSPLQTPGKVTPGKLLKMFKAARGKQATLQSQDSQKSSRNNIQSLVFNDQKGQDPLKTEVVSEIFLDRVESSARIHDGFMRNTQIQKTEGEHLISTVHKSEFENLNTQVHKTEFDNLNTLVHKTEIEVFHSNTQAQRTEFELFITSARSKSKPHIRASQFQLQGHCEINPGTDPLEINSNVGGGDGSPRAKQHIPEKFQKDVHTEKITLGRASSVGSSIGAHMGFLRSIIIERKTPAVLTAVNLFGLISLISTVASVLLVYFILSDSYGTFTLFAQSASFPSIMRAISPSYMIANEIGLSTIQLFPPAIRAAGAEVAATYARYFYKFGTAQYFQFILNFDLPSLSENILRLSIPVNFLDFPQLDRDLNFYEANEVYQAYVYKHLRYNFYSGKLDLALLNFTRTFIPAFNEMYHNISDENFEHIYELHDSTNLILDVIMVIGVIISVILMITFIPIYGRYQKMETVAFTKLCGITMKELEPSLKKITLSYEQLFGKPLPALKKFKENVSYKKKKSKDSFKSISSQTKNGRIRRNPFARRSIAEKSSTLLLVITVLFVSFLLSAAYIVINIVFKNANAKILPFITDLEKISEGLPACYTAQSVMVRLLNEILNPKISETLPILMDSYQETLNESVVALKEMNNHLINSIERAESTDVLSPYTKQFFSNITNDSWCHVKFDDGSDLYSICVTSMKRVASSGFPAVGNKLMEGYISQIKTFVASPTIISALTFYLAPDVLEFLYMTLLDVNFLLQMLKHEQADVGAYTENLYAQTRLMLILALLYNVVVLFLLWMPTITYLRKRFILARSIFLLMPTKVLLHNSGVNNLFKVW